MGCKPALWFQGEAVFDYKDCPISCRVRFNLRFNSVKKYDKCSVLRVETTINDPREWKVYATVYHHDGTESEEWKPMGISISKLYRCPEVSKSCNQRFLDAMVDIIPAQSILDVIGKACFGEKLAGRKDFIGSYWFARKEYNV